MSTDTTTTGTQHSTLDTSLTGDGSVAIKQGTVVSNSIWSNLIYGLIMLVIIAVPPLIPGASIRVLIMGYILLLLAIYATATIVALKRTLQPVQTSRRTS